MWLEGADWDIENKMLIESNKNVRFVRFPAIRVKTVLKKKNTKPKLITPRNESSLDDEES